jgi:hypothetical protein
MDVFLKGLLFESLCSDSLLFLLPLPSSPSPPASASSWQVSYSLRRLTAFQTQNLYVGPQPQSEPAKNPLFPGVEAKPDPIKGGLRVTPYFTYNCLAVSHVTTPQPIRRALFPFLLPV